MDRIRVGVVGIGNMGRHHVRVYSQLRHMCKLIGVYDVNPEVACGIAETYKVKVFDNLQSMIEEVDAVSIAVPTIYHKDIALQFLTAGKHVLLEKPIATSIEEGQAIIDASRGGGLVLQIGHVERFNPAVREISNIVQQHIVRVVNIERLSPYDRRVADIDVIQDLTVHDIDIIESIFKPEIVHINAVGIKVKSPVVDHAEITLLSKDNTVFSISTSRITEQKIRKMTITTDSAYIEMDYMDKKITISRRAAVAFESGENLRYRQENIIEKVFVPNQEPLMVQLEHFLKCIEMGREPIVTGEDGLKALQIIEQIRRIVYQ